MFGVFIWFHKKKEKRIFTPELHYNFAYRTSKTVPTESQCNRSILFSFLNKILFLSLTSIFPFSGKFYLELFNDAESNPAPFLFFISPFIIADFYNNFGGFSMEMKLLEFVLDLEERDCDPGSNPISYYRILMKACHENGFSPLFGNLFQV